MAAPIDIVYAFRWPDGETKTLKLSLESETSELLDPMSPAPPWAALDYNKCSHCPYRKESTPNCPVAARLGGVLKAFSDYKSHNELEIVVTTAERTYSKFTSLQSGLQSVFGLIIATSGCPYLKFLKPMARFHLPFSSLDETVVRSTSFYLLKQYFIARAGGVADLQLKGLEDAYGALLLVNEGLAKRIAAMRHDFQSGLGDAGPNAIVILDSLAQMLSMEINSELSSLAPIFAD
jgi:hypothetical protein